MADFSATWRSAHIPTERMQYYEIKFGLHIYYYREEFWRADHFYELYMRD